MKPATRLLRGHDDQRHVGLDAPWPALCPESKGPRSAQARPYCSPPSCDVMAPLASMLPKTRGKPSSHGAWKRSPPAPHSEHPL